MFTFFHRIQPIHLDAFTCNAAAYRATPIINSFRAMPEWMDKVPKSKQSYGYDHNGNIANTSRRSIRTCKGFIDLYRRGFIVESWADFIIDVKHDRYSYHYTNGSAPVVFQPDIDVYPGFERHYIMKLSTPWMIQTKERIPFITLGTEWSLEHLDVKMIPGSVNFKDTNTTNIFVVFKKPEICQDYQIKIPIGEPLQQFVPLTERKLKIKNHLVSSDEMNKMRMSEKTSIHGWRKVSSLIKRNEERMERKCPLDYWS